MNPNTSHRAKNVLNKAHVPNNPYSHRAYVMKEHDATRRHYDLRLEFEGRLLSWDLPVGPSCRAGLLREAIEMEDHNPANITFEGVHETGPMMLWDRGTWELHPEYTDIGECLRKGVLRFILHGEKLEGGWTLRRTNRITSSARPIWTLCKDFDSYARNEPGIDFLEQKGKSVLTGRSMEMIVHDWNNPRDKHPGQMNLFD